MMKPSIHPSDQASNQALKSQILYQDEDLLALDKPTDFPSIPHPDRPLEEKTMVSLAIEACPELITAWPESSEKGLLHRLDRGTSGVLLFAKNQKTFNELKNNWKKSSIIKTYRALSTLNDPLILKYKLPYLCEIQMGHDLKSKKKMRAVRQDVDLKRIRSKPREALTQVLEIHDLKTKREGLSVYDVKVQITTGVMHQIRVHLMELGLPILGDPLYGEVSDSRLWLHALSIQIKRDSGRSMTIEAPLPKDWIV
jgi:23S rRNA pseudouridine1911/1915/1917 synthase